MEKEIGRFGKNSFESIRVCLTPYRGKDYLDLRILVQDKTGSWIPTRKGICIGVGLISELRSLLAKAEDAIPQMGVLPADD